MRTTLSRPIADCRRARSTVGERAFPWPVTCGWSPSSTCCATAPTTPSPKNRALRQGRWPRPDCHRCPSSPYMPGLSGDVAPVAGFDYDALHFLRRAYLLQVCGLRGDPGGRTGRRLRAVAGDVRGDGPAVAPGLALRPRGRVRPRGLRRSRCPTTNSSRAAARWAPPRACCGSWSSSPRRSASTRRTRRRRREPPDRPTSLEEPAGPDSVRREPVRPGTACVAGAARGGDAEPGQGSMIIFS